MPPIDQDQRADNIKTEYEIDALHKELNQLRASVESLQRDRERALLWGVLALGSAVMGMGMWIFNNVLARIK